MTPRAVRVMRARRTGGACHLCRRTLIRGTSIALAGGRWVHTSCLVDRARDEIAEQEGITTS